MHATIIHGVTVAWIAEHVLHPTVARVVLVIYISTVALSFVMLLPFSLGAPLDAASAERLHWLPHWPIKTDW